MQFPKTSKELAQDIIVHLGHPTTPTNIKQMQTLLDAFLKFVDRNEVYVDLWKDGGVEDSARNGASKCARLEAIRLSVEAAGGFPADGSLPGVMQALYETGMDSAIDLINYGAFAARNLHSRRMDGKTGDIRTAV